jgi:phage-related baseplate assembly protein
MSDFNLSQLPNPGVIEELSFDAVYAQLLQDFQRRFPDYSAVLESDPATKLMEAFAYRELLLRNRINEAAQANLLAFAKGSDLDHLASFYDVTRHLVDPGNPNASPQPIPPTWEDDDSLRHRVWLRIQGSSSAGPAVMYRYHCLSAHPDIIDCYVDSPSSGHVRCVILGREGSKPDEVEAAARDYITREDVRVLTDTVEVMHARVVPVSVEAKVYLYPEIMEEMVHLPDIAGLINDSWKIGEDLARSAIIRELHVAGVIRMDLESPVNDIQIANTEVARIVDASVLIAGREW